ncbi:hypothetical protein [Natrialba sp. INN-245]|nr:hypothetical protein [Natrialba sp. INN-245]
MYFLVSRKERAGAIGSRSDPEPETELESGESATRESLLDTEMGSNPDE